MLDSPLAFSAFIATLVLTTAARLRVFTSRLGDRGFEVRLASLLAIVRIPYEAIAEVKKVHALQVWLQRPLEMFNAARAGTGCSRGTPSRSGGPGGSGSW